LAIGVRQQGIKETTAPLPDVVKSVMARGPKEQPPQKSYQRILEQEINEGLREINRPPLGLLISGISAGLEVSFSVFLMGVLLTLVKEPPASPIAAIMIANAYSIGFIFVILGRSELFTEHTTRAIYPILANHAPLSALLKLWVIVLAGNLVGTAIFSEFTVIIGPALGVIDMHALGEVGKEVVAHHWWVIVLSGLMAGWMMGLLSWLVTAGRDTISQVFFVWVITSAIGICHFHHSIVGSCEVLSNIFAGQGLVLRDYGNFLLWSATGNAIGGGVFVGLLKYSHVVRGAADQAPVKVDDLQAQ
jgi:formate-nitrite transporter family protein